MPISVDWSTKTINIPQSYLTLLSGTLYELDTNQLRLDLKALEAEVVDSGAGGMAFDDTHRHSTEAVISGFVYSRTIEIINGYSIVFEDGQYAVNLAGSNNNILDVTTRNQVSVGSQNSAGLILGTANVTSTDVINISDAVWNAITLTHTATGSFGFLMTELRKTFLNRLTKSGSTVTIYDDDGTTPLYTISPFSTTERGALSTI